MTILFTFSVSFTEVSEEHRGARADAGGLDGGYTPLAPAEKKGG